MFPNLEPEIKCVNKTSLNFGKGGGAREFNLICGEVMHPGLLAPSVKDLVHPNAKADITMLICMS